MSYQGADAPDRNRTDNLFMRVGLVRVDVNLEQMEGIEPAFPVWGTGVSPQHFTCLAVSVETGFDRRWRPGARLDDLRVGRVGIEPTFRRIKSPVQSQRLLPTRSSHPLESNQNLSVFSRARRPTTQGRERSRCAPTSLRVRSAVSSGACLAPVIVILFSCHRSRRRRAQGAPRAAMLPRFAQSHLSR
jgi:hypothetical protein